MGDPRAYEERRSRFLEVFAQTICDETSVQISLSPSGRYRLEIARHEQPDNRWDYSRGVVTDLRTERTVADIRRNYGHFWHAWVLKGDGSEYLLCGEDYQGYNVIDLATGANRIEFGESGYKGWGFCWAAAQPSPDGRILVVEGCHWACPYELVFFDFRDPSTLPLPELFRVSEDNAPGQWVGNGEYHYKVALETIDGEDKDEDMDPPMVDAVWRRPEWI
jgi:hypothetical protein